MIDHYPQCPDPEACDHEARLEAFIEAIREAMDQTRGPEYSGWPA